MPEIPLLSNFYKNPILIDLFQEESKLKNLHNGLELSYIDINFLKKRDISKDQRLTLYNVLSEQYSNCGLEIPKNLKSIKNKGVFTITTGHQLCAFGGPQYFIHKIISVIKIAENLKVKYIYNLYEFMINLLNLCFLFFSFAHYCFLHVFSWCLFGDLTVNYSINSI